jgi:hypothetical protein
MLIAVHYDERTGKVFGTTMESDGRRILRQSTYGDGLTYGIVRKAPREITQMAEDQKLRIKDINPDGTVEVELERGR